MEHLHGMVLEPQDILSWRPLSAGQLALTQLRDQFPKAKLHFWQESARSKALLMSALSKKGWGQMLKKAWPLGTSSGLNPIDLSSDQQVDLVYACSVASQ
jgi:hypothetical protein